MNLYKKCEYGTEKPTRYSVNNAFHIWHDHYHEHLKTMYTIFKESCESFEHKWGIAANYTQGIDYTDFCFYLFKNSSGELK
jgi:hypothetical protein